MTSKARCGRLACAAGMLATHDEETTPVSPALSVKSVPKEQLSSGWDENCPAPDVLSTLRK
jgi:hypothetical protein